MKSPPVFMQEPVSEASHLTIASRFAMSRATQPPRAHPVHSQRGQPSQHQCPSPLGQPAPGSEIHSVFKSLDVMRGLSRPLPTASPPPQKAEHLHDPFDRSAHLRTGIAPPSSPRCEIPGSREVHFACPESVHLLAPILPVMRLPIIPIYRM